MLVLTRSLYEQIAIGDDVILTVEAIKGGQVQIAIEAPYDIPVMREEIYIKPEDSE